MSEDDQTSPNEVVKPVRGSRRNIMAELEVLESARKQRAKERLSEGRVDVAIDRSRLREIEIQPRDRFKDRRTGKATSTGDVELQSLLERIQRLPENLQFNPGITLIVGENGAGKSTFGKSLFLAIKYFIERETSGNEDKAYREVFVDNEVNGIWLRQSGLAPNIAQCLRVNIGADLELEEYEDFPAVIGRHISGEENDYYGHARNQLMTSLINKETMKTDSYKSFYNDYSSHRQTVDRFVFEKIKRRQEGHPGPRIHFFDEPETGLSPRRHKQLEDEIKEATARGSLIIVPTNSVVLYDSNLPRIDLEFPEIGIYLPSSVY